MIFGHVFAGPLTHQYIYAWHVPVFFVLTGYLWTPGRTVRRELVTRTRSLALPYVGWLVVLVAVLLLDRALHGGIDLGALLGALWGGAEAGGYFGTFWFVSTLLFAAMLFRLVERLPRTGGWIIAAAGLVAGYLVGGWLAHTPLAIGTALPCLVFLVAGSLLRQFRSRITFPLLTGLVLLLVSLVVMVFVPLTPVDIKVGSFGTPVIGVVLAIAISFGLLLVFERIPFAGRSSRVITSLAVVGIAVVLLHPSVIVLAGARVPKILILLAAIVLPWAVALALYRTPLSVILIGARKRRSPPANSLVSRGSGVHSSLDEDRAG